MLRPSPPQSRFPDRHFLETGLGGAYGRENSVVALSGRGSGRGRGRGREHLPTRKVGSSFWKRESALLSLSTFSPLAFMSIARETTAGGTYIEGMVYGSFVVKVSPEARAQGGTGTGTARANAWSQVVWPRDRARFMKSQVYCGR